MIYTTIKYKTFPIKWPSFPLGDPIAVRIIPTIGKAIQYLNITVKIEVLVNCNKTPFIHFNLTFLSLRSRHT